MGDSGQVLRSKAYSKGACENLLTKEIQWGKSRGKAFPHLEKGPHRHGPARTKENGWAAKQGNRIDPRVCFVNGPSAFLAVGKGRGGNQVKKFTGKRGKKV